MAHPSISVYVSSGAASDRRVNIACELAQKMNAKLVGLGCQSISSKNFPNGPVSNRLLKLEYEHAAAELTQREKRFRELAACKTPHIEWRRSNDYPLKAFINKLRSVDLLVIGSDSEAPLEHRFRSSCRRGGRFCTCPITSKPFPFAGRLSPRKMVVSHDAHSPMHCLF